MELHKSTGLSQLQKSRVYDTVLNIIDNLPPRALNQLLEGYSNDVDLMLEEMAKQTEYALNLGKTIDSEMLDYVDRVKASMDESLKIQSWSYFNATVLGSKFRMNYRNLEVCNLVSLFPWSGYLMSRSSGKCGTPETEVVMYDGSLKMMKDIKVGDLVMGPDSTPRKVLELHRGKAPMYRVKQSYAMDYEVNEGHLICCRIHKSCYDPIKRKSNVEIIYRDIPVEAVLNQAGYPSKKVFGYCAKGWDLPEKELPLEPYYLGIWLGDGNSNSSVISKPDKEIHEYMKGYAERLGGIFKDSEQGDYKNTCRMNILNQKGTLEIIKPILRELNLLNNKHIPDIYMRGSRKQRLELLAGLLDADSDCVYRRDQVNLYGKINKARSCEFSSINKTLAHQVQQLAWSLGLRCKSVKEKKRDIKLKRKRTGEEYLLGDYVFYKLWISGDVHDIPIKIERKKIPFVDKVQDNSVSSLQIEKKDEGEYCGFSCDGDHKFLLKDGTVFHNSYQFAWSFPLWRLYSYRRPTFYQPNTIDNQNRKETALITNTMTLAKTHVAKIIEEIETNDILTSKLNPNNKAKIGETAIETELGSILHVRGKDGFIRGLHVGAALVDDLPDESSLYSDEQREKLKEVFRGTITPIVESYGFLIVSGTPYSTAPNELYNLIKADKRFAVFEYPIIFPDGRPLAPDRFTFEQILKMKEELGTMVFSREYLVVPIADSSTIFPYDFLMRSTVGMENLDFAESIDTYPFKMKKVIIGIDFATSGNIGADYTVFTCWGVDYQDNYHLINIWRKQGASHNEQIDKIVLWDRLYKPNTTVCEANGFQGILSDMARQRGLKNIEKFTTTEGNKKDLHSGWPSLSAMFERGQIRIPFKHGPTRDLTEIIFGEFSSITFRSDKGKLEAVGAHDDIVSSSFQAINKLRETSSVQFKVDYV